MSTVETDYLVEYLAHAPVALGLLRAIECRTLAALEFEHPILDVGCGDGLFGQVFFRDGVDVGLDYSAKELHTAAQRGAYHSLMRGDVACLPFADRSFATVFSNGVLEHVHDLAGGLREIARVLRPGGQLIFTVPTMEDELQLSGAALLRRLGLHDLAQRYADTYNHLFAQINVFPLETWRKYLADSGLVLVSGQAYAAPAVFRWHDLLLPASVPSFVCKRFTGRWSVLTGLRRVTVAPLWSTLLRRLYLDEMPGCSLLMIAEPRLERAPSVEASPSHLVPVPVGECACKSL
jgi:SAM-dependent methyltransferase